MLIENQTLWQIGTGDYSRDYSKLCLEFGIAMVGPGQPGNAKEHPELYEGENDWGIKLKQIKNNEIVLLRRGQTTIKAVGVVTNDYAYSLSLADIHGWDLNHYITVEWYVQENGEDIVLSHAMIGYSTMSSVNKNYDEIKRFLNSKKLIRYKSKRKLSKLRYPKEVTISDLKNHFIEHGIRIGDAINIADTIEKVIILVKWYQDYDPDVLEHELRAFLVIPFLLSLGWSEQKIKIEYNKIDIALFSKPFTSNHKEDPFVIIETKTFKDGLSLAKEQLDNYAERYPKCKIMVTTNGYRYYVYKKGKEAFELFSYFNLLDMREFDYITNDILGALDGMISMSNY